VTPEQRSLFGRIGSAIARSRHDPRDLTSEARRTFLARFERQAREHYPDLPDAEIERRAGELRKAWMLRLSLKSSIARAKKRTATRDKVTALEDRDGAATPRRPAA
jgi:hypothetical protein